MANLNTMPERFYHMLEESWHRIPYSYRTPLILTSCTAILFTPLVWKKLTYQPELLPPHPKNHVSRLRNADEHSASFTLPNGRTIGYAQFGDPKGKPIITLHGIIGSRLENALFDANAKELGIRIIGIERPGLGKSSPDPRSIKERKVIDHAQDVEALAEHLQLDEYAVLGTSGGGPYALGCARALPSSTAKPKLKAVSIVTGLGLADMSQAWPAPLVWLNRNFDLRWLIKLVFVRGPVFQLHLSDDERREGARRNFDVKKAHPADVEVAKHPNQPDWMQLFLDSIRAAASQGWQGYLDDAAILSADPGFCVEDIPADLPVQLWYGADDTNVSPKAGNETADRLRAGGNTKVELHMYPGETHGSTQVKYQRQILEDLLRAMGP